ncbi:IST1 homolog isoform X2 [Hyalella azteca]|uniref:IST1 homolog n=1 Tax=Hyalella azteca TaxID=294128 RepID=A0A8B7NRV5_HYAAZ|nr:IST1 homolog isoform X3 [Hyalella azteca]XP_047739967.1 IST1 homolog isoform X2 [Hyalella azteca]
MFSSGPSYAKLKTNLRLSINRLKLLEKKKTELTQKARKEIADYIAAGKIERAKIRVEHIIREDYLVEAMEVTEMYCDLVLARFGLIQQMKDLDPGLSEAISSLVWCAPRLMSDVPELKIVADQFALKYGKPYAVACREQSISTISEKLIHKLSVQAPPKVLVEKYLQEIAHNYNLEYTPDPQIMRESEWGADALITLDDVGKSDGASGGASGGGGGGIPQQPFSYPNKAAEAMASSSVDLNLPNVPGMAAYPQPFVYPTPTAPFNYPGPPGGPPPPPEVEPEEDPLVPPARHEFPTGDAGTWNDTRLSSSPPPPYTSIGTVSPPSAPPSSLPAAAPSHSKLNFPPDVPATSDEDRKQPPQPSPRSKFGVDSDAAGDDLGFSLPDLPNVPTPSTNANNDASPTNADDIDFDDLNKRFQNLKKK